MQKNVRYAELVAHESGAGSQLRRQPPSTLLPDVEAYSKDLVAI